MADALLSNPIARKLATMSGLPIVPHPLKRARGAGVDRPLAEQQVLVAHPFAEDEEAGLAAHLAPALAEAGAAVTLWQGATLSTTAATAHQAYSAAGEAWGQQVSVVGTSDAADKARFAALLFDASGLSELTDLSQLHHFFHPWLRGLKKGGRILMLARPAAEADSPRAATVRQAQAGVARSIAKELGRKGITSNLIWVPRGTERHLAGLVRFILSRRAAWFSAQELWLSDRIEAPASPRSGPKARENVDALEPSEPARVPLARCAMTAATASWTRPLEGKVALVTGSARGIGAATARRLAEEGARVIVLDRPADTEGAARVAAEIGGIPAGVDVSREDAPEALIAFLQEHTGGHVDIVVHNAGVTRDKTLGRMSFDKWDMVLNINLRAILRIDDALLAGGHLRDGGRIIVLSSVTGLAGNLGQTNYAATKAGLIGYVRALAPSLAERGITANAVAPGFIETRMTARMPAGIKEPARRLSTLAQGGQPVDVAELITFLSTPSASGLTGQVVRICGGSFIGA